MGSLHCRIWTFSPITLTASVVIAFVLYSLSSIEFDSLLLQFVEYHDHYLVRLYAGIQVGIGVVIGLVENEAQIEYGLHLTVFTLYHVCQVSSLLLVKSRHVGPQEIHAAVLVNTVIDTAHIGNL